MRGSRAKQIRRLARQEAERYTPEPPGRWLRFRIWWLEFRYGKQARQRRHQTASARFNHRYLKRFWKEGQRDGT